MAKSKPPPNLALQRERLRQQMSRSELARQTRLPRKTLIAVENGQDRVRMETAKRIATALKKDIPDLFDCTRVIG